MLVIITTSVTSCAPKGYVSHESGFFSGLWHGFIIVFSLIGKLFGMNIGIYAEHNTGFTYWLGFIIGIGGSVEVVLLLEDRERYTERYFQK